MRTFIPSFIPSLVAGLLISSAAVALPVSFSTGPAVTVVGGYSQSVLQTTVGITNTGTPTLTLGLERQIRLEVAGSENNFCFGVGCYPPSVSVAPDPVTLAAGATDNSLVIDYTPNGLPGITVIRYAVYNRTGTGTAADTAYITVTFDARQAVVTGRADDLAASLLLTAPAPNPAAAGTDVTLTIGVDAPRGAALRLVDLRDGRTVRTVALTADFMGKCGTVAPVEPINNTCSGGSGTGPTPGIVAGGCYGPNTPAAPTRTPAPAPTTIRVSTAGLAAGVYGCQLVDGHGQPRAMRRLVVQ